MRIIWVIIGWIVSIFVMNMVDILRFFMIFPEPTAMAIVIPLIMNHPLHVNALYDLTFMTLLVYIGSRFEHINQHIQALIQKKKRYVRQAWATFTSSLIHRHMAGTEISQQIIWILMHIHLELCSISQDLNMIFGLQMLMQAIAFHVFTVQLVNEFYHTVTMLNYDTPNGIRIHIFIIFVWAITGIIKMVVFNYICETICNKANQTEVHLNGLTNLIFDVNTQENITQFLLQLLRKPLKISGFRLFYFGYKFVFECVNYIAMVILFVIQTHPQGPHMKEILQFILQVNQKKLKLSDMSLFHFGYNFLRQVCLTFCNK
ncbi:uncharacterized protein [Linepithema humile]|uniref:uncharacterized protein n=1 Tax=Linepithema humile TaxID=83485 RepID=UPI00351DBF61